MAANPKITPATLIDLNKLKGLAPILVPLDLFDVFGIITHRKRKLTDYSESITFVGRFEAVALDAGLAIAGGVVRGDKAYFPPELERLITAAFPDKGQANIQIGMRIGVGPVPAGEKVACGYVWRFESLIKPSESSAVSMLREQFDKRPANALR